jgi:hypothetical protein
VTVSNRRLLRIATGCTTRDKFVAAFSRFHSPGELFIATKTPKVVGESLDFAITLTSGVVMIEGRGQVIESSTDKHPTHGRPGMLIRFAEVTSGKGVLDAMAAFRRPGAPVPVTVPVMVPAPVTLPPPSATSGAAAHAAAGAGGATPAAASDSDGAWDDVANEVFGTTRVKGGRDILPANPFGELPDSSLEAFVECTVYEDLTGDGEPDEDDGGGEAGGDDDGEVRAPLAAAGSAPQAAPPANRAPSKPNIPGTIPTPPPGSLSAVALPGMPPVAGAAPGGAVPGWSPAEGPAAADPLLDAPAPFAYPTGGPTVMAPRGASYVDDLAALMTPRARPMQLVIGGALLLGVLLGFAIGRLSAPSDGAGEAAAAIAPTEHDSEADLAAAVPGPAEPAGAAADDEAADDEAEDHEPAGAGKPIAARPPLAPDACALSIETRPPGATVMVDGQEVGASPLDVPVGCGKRTVQVARARYEDASRTVVATAGTPTDVRFALERPQHDLLVTASPAGAMVTVDGRFLGKAPVKLKVRAFQKHTIVVEAPGHAPQRKSTFARSPRETVRISLKKK